MSAQHKNLAEVWHLLQGRQDISNILRDIVGQLSLDLTSREDDSRIIEDATRRIIWIKTIFDLQRTYLNGNAKGLVGCPPYVLPYLLPAELLFSTILYLVNVKTKLFPSQAVVTRDFRRPRHILAQSLLSGLRLLLLRKELLAAHDKRRLQASINAAWQHDRLQGIEGFIVSEIFAGALDLMNEPTLESPYAQEWGNAKLPTWEEGLYPLSLRPETFVTALIHGTMEEDWVDAYWVLYDCLWAVESAIVQRLVDLIRRFNVVNHARVVIDADETLQHLCQAKTSLIISIFHRIPGPMTPAPALLDSLAITLLEWDEALDSFLSRQDSLIQQTSTVRPIVSRNHRKNVLEIAPYLEDATTSFTDWLSRNNFSQANTNIPRSEISSSDLQEEVQSWLCRMSPNETDSQGMSILPVYIVDCPKLHVLPKRLLEYKLRWCDKWAYESLQENSPTVQWKDGVQCPSCASMENIKFARLIEPFQRFLVTKESNNHESYSLRRFSVNDTGSYDATSNSATSRSTSEENASALSLHTQPTVLSIPSHTISVSRESEIFPQVSVKPPDYSQSPISPTCVSPISPRTHFHRPSPHSDHPISPISESLNIPIPLASRLSIDLPIPVDAQLFAETLPESLPEILSVSAPSDTSSIRLDTPSTDSMWSGASMTKTKTASRTVRIANSIRRKPTCKEKDQFPLPKDPCFAFSTSGHTLLLWGRGADSLIRFEIPSNDTSSIQGCRYETSNIEAVAAGNHRCAIISAGPQQKHKLVVYSGLNTTPEHEAEIDFTGRAGDICLAVSRNDKYIATSMNDHIQIFTLENGLKTVPFHNQIQVFELRGGNPHRRTLQMGRTTSDESMTETHGKGEPGWFDVHSRALSQTEAAEEQRRQTAIVSRKLSFSTDSNQLVVATQLGDHCVYVDVYDCSRAPVSNLSEHSRSFKMPPWTLNDGDLTSVFYDSNRKSAIVTAFLGKEYPLLVPFPGYGTLQNETYSTKIVDAAQSPSGTTFIVANSMTEIIQFEYNAKGALSPRKLKKSTGKISNGAFKPGAMAMAMPLENILQCFWLKEGKCMLRRINIGSTETFQDYDIRPQYDRLMSMRKNPVIARAPSLSIPELDDGT
ncbi:hypothetical protein B0J11DRAFT_98340 [Dendryphion nanum]|uniref:DUF7100 domain-containing protein n=1 Tax=Dendryphion nanum TaxID=256645 RepID=A0A9P9IDU0_9PLEO|nr:hypothetical protein B0J11DRAFT_98340 [Dendryphion nanum]